jgi:hypothetical protein
MAKFDPAKLSEADRDSIRRLEAASRRRSLKAFSAAALAVALVLPLAGIPAALVFYFFDDWKIAAELAIPGLAAAWWAYSRIHPSEVC